jgi:hypothetical protein
MLSSQHTRKSGNLADIIGGHDVIVVQHRITQDLDFIQRIAIFSIISTKSMNKEVIRHENHVVEVGIATREHSQREHQTPRRSFRLNHISQPEMDQPEP